MSETKSEESNIIKTSEIIAQGGMLEVGDSTRRMEIMKEAEEKGSLIQDGDASSVFEKMRKLLSGNITL